MTRPTISKRGDENGVSLFIDPVVSSVDKNDKSAHQQYDLPIRSGPPVEGGSNLKFRKHIKTFEGGTPHEFVNVWQAIREIWKRSNLEAADERLNVISNLILGDDLDTLMTAIKEERTK